MFCWISIVGGLLIMMGQHARSEALFYYFRLEDQVPETHLLRLIDKHISFGFVRERLKESYSETGRPSIDPELLLRILLIGYLYGISSERKLVEELRMHLAWRWFTGLGFDQEIPHHSTFSKNRHGRFQESTTIACSRQFIRLSTLRYLVLTGVPDDSQTQLQTRQASPAPPIAERLRASIHWIGPRGCS
jgi:transposase